MKVKMRMEIEVRGLQRCRISDVRDALNKALYPGVVKVRWLEKPTDSSQPPKLNGIPDFSEYTRSKKK